MYQDITIENIKSFGTMEKCMRKPAECMSLATLLAAQAIQKGDRHQLNNWNDILKDWQAIKNAGNN
ncbi:hypothetical protein [Liquorilactobacillus nagelii]|uniref:hypothetical protein n=1 Tax=Liquorilactobacillus nagelii TaxID=82688 RepID=UPI001CC974F7|nr:hypothetical protein [Liquorilactobacillus nagelii]ULQ49026.1 hypothetical protein J6864_08660 [Liquorilactobacillus nagelii]